MSEIIESSTKPKPFVFVVMPFSKEFDDVYQLGIKAACSEAGAYCERLDEQVFDDGMLDQIYNQIAKADMIVADMTGQNANVFYEVGYAHALGKRVVLITKSATDIPFDLKHRFHIVYDGSITALKSKLFERVSWYVSNPGERQVVGVDRLEFFVDGVPLESGGEHLTKNVHHMKSQVWRLDIVAHNPSGIARDTVRFGAGLLTPAIFSFCLNHEFGKTDSLPLPKGIYLHQQIGEFEVPPGGWVKLVFPLTRPDIANQGSGIFNVTLRVLGGGMHRDIEFIIKNELSDDEARFWDSLVEEDNGITNSKT